MNHKVPVWIVEDDEDDQYLIKLAFESIVPPVSVKLLADGDQLVPSLNQASSLPKLVLLDLNMNRQNGYETLQEIRSIPHYEGLPIVILTTSDDNADALRSYRLGANGFVTKSASQNDLVSLAQSIANTWSLTD
ncbi:response regulator [Spirosoma harenae]